MLFMAAASKDKTSVQTALMVQLINTAFAVYEMHQQASRSQREQQVTQTVHETQVRAAAWRAAVQGALAPVHKDQWWDHAQPNDVAQAMTDTSADSANRPSARAGSPE